MPQPPETLNSFEALLQVIRDLRGPEGCPWDKEQNQLTLTPYAIEEVHELVEAIESGDDRHICEELGDVLFQVVLHAQLSKERGAFTISEVIEAITTKIVRRHPHVFANTKVSGRDEVLTNWEEIKRLEKKDKPPKNGVFDVPPGLPALQRAHKIGEKTANMNFDWADAAPVLAQLKAEIAELEVAIAEQNLEHISHELGDVLFSAAQLARHLDCEPESALREANRRFSGRFEKMVGYAGSLEKFIKLSSVEKELLWSRAKQQN